MKYVELFLIFVAIVCIYLHSDLVVGAGALLVITLSILSMFYQFFGFALLNGIGLRKLFRKKTYQDTSAMSFVGAAVTGFMVLSIAPLALLFNFMSYSGASEMITIGMAALIVTNAVALIIWLVKKAKNCLLILKRTVPFTLALIVFVIHTPEEWNMFRHRNYPGAYELHQQMMQHPEDMDILCKYYDAIDQPCF